MKTCGLHCFLRLYDLNKNNALDIDKIKIRKTEREDDDISECEVREFRQN